ncbi:FtsK/SpoIIIE domain-containing protein [Pseudarthrobacter sp. NIBRBAC000502771]|uniref:FtsK/SpoIIIE domain-containing protein n=1 Tax=Pseudarthrobacter sp. NIBRBAC000502771 TaxID=2590774 RepID=UPI0011309870|nr:FtsK/SpoIIIE domain-containing protein [Pseudarthrobacter sp. NIBRBAC000502771]QDG63007.1 FHA domain-containing protein [Pseudarthrobacter sp. NIBRBAC000502771]
MMLNCTLVDGPGSARGQAPVELSISAPAGTAGSVIHEHLVRKFRAGIVAVKGEDLRSLVLGVAPLVEAAVLVDGGTSLPAGRTRQRPAPGTAPPLVLAVDSGPAAGTVVPLRRGNYSIGRSGTRIAIPDPELSREHARIVVTDTDILLIDLDSANGTYVDGERIRTRVISTESSIRCGQSTLSLVIAEPPGRALADAGSSVTEPIVVQGRANAGNRTALVLAAVLPLAIGVLLAIFTGMWMFLAFSAASVVSVLVPAVSGRREKREFSHAMKAAVAEDRERRRRSAPPLSLVALAAQPADGTSGTGARGVWLRLGQADQAANVRIEGQGAGRAAPSAGMVPVVLDPDCQFTAVIGPRSATDGAMRSVLMQLAGYPGAGATHVLVHGNPESLPLAARYLPRVTLAATPHAAIAVVNKGHPRGCERGVLLIQEDTPAEAANLSVREAAIRRGWQVLQFQAQDGASPSSNVVLAERDSVLAQDHRETTFVPDLVPDTVFSDFCRHMAVVRRQDNDRPGNIPAVCGLGDVLPLTPDATADRWQSSLDKDGLAIPLGICASGTKTIDLQYDGPHLLVAGTTGSGKSELLRSLTLALALSYPPERVNFFFIDFKGGSGLGPLSGLVHCVGLQTDLASSDMERTLTSLRAELRLREKCLADANVPDITTYRSTSASEDFALPHLVIVIDEFRMLVDDLPEVLRELLRIASIGRSLGIHLIMATQRPQGALTADIRANVTTSIALRVQSDMESVDIINCRSAAQISVDAPGRAFLVRGTEAAEEFQGASLASVAADQGPGFVSVRRTTDFLACQVAGPANAPAPVSTPVQAVEPLLALVRNLCTHEGKKAPRRPVAPALPEDLEEPAPRPSPASGVPGLWAPEHADAASGVCLGLMDTPDKQRLEPLVWDPAHHGHAAFIGSPASGSQAAQELAVHKLLTRPQEAHFYVLDAAGSFLGLAGTGRMGARAGLDDLRRGVRILERLAGELGRRRSHPAQGQVRVVLVVSGWGSWVSAFRSGPLAWAEDLVHDLVRDGAKAGITVLLTGERELVTARFFGAVPNRFYFPAGSTEEGRAMWPRIPSMPATEGRAVAFGPVSGGSPAICQIYRRRAPEWPLENGPEYPGHLVPPIRVEPLPALITVREVEAMALAAVEQPPTVQIPAGQDPSASDRGTGSTPVHAVQRDKLLGVAGDEVAAAFVRVPGNTVVAVLGGPGSGKSNTLRALQALNPSQPWRAHQGPPHSPEEFWAGILRQAEDRLFPRETTWLVDDADQLAPQALRDLGQLHSLGHSLVVSAAYSPMLLQRVPLMMTARASGIGLLLGPRSMADGDLFGVRFDVESNSPPGRAVLISGGRAVPFQVAWAGTDE